MKFLGNKLKLFVSQVNFLRVTFPFCMYPVFFQLAMHLQTIWLTKITSKKPRQTQVHKKDTFSSQSYEINLLVSKRSEVCNSFYSLLPMKHMSLKINARRTAVLYSQSVKMHSILCIYERVAKQVFWQLAFLSTFFHDWYLSWSPCDSNAWVLWILNKKSCLFWGRIYIIHIVICPFYFLERSLKKKLIVEKNPKPSNKKSLWNCWRNDMWK